MKQARQVMLLVAEMSSGEQLISRSSPRAGLKHLMNFDVLPGLGHRWSFIGLLMAGALITAPGVLAADARPAPGGRIRKAEAAPATGATPLARAVAAKGSDYDRMPVVLGLEGKQLEKYQAALKARDEAYAKWLKSPEGQKYDAAEKEMRQTRRGRNRQAAEEAKKKYAPLRAEQEKVRSDLRREFNKQFNPEQLRLWAGDMLYTEVMQSFAPARLSDEQKAQALAICCVLADVSEVGIKHDPYLEPNDNLKERATSEISRMVLRADQQR
jgi:hypothetical protein